MEVSLKLAILCLVCFQFFSFCIASDTSSSCTKPRCNLFRAGKPSRTIIVEPADDGEKQTTFCFNGLDQSIRYIWANPVLKVTRKNTSEEFNFLAYYGTSVEDVDFRRQQPGYLIVQKLLSSSRYYKETEDFSFNPFNLSCFLIDSDVTYTAKFHLKAVEVWYICYLMIGAVIFFSAKSWSHNTTLHYTSGVSFGVLASVLILVFIVSRFLPSRFKSIGYILMLLGSSVSLWLLRSFSSYLQEPVTDRLIENWQYLAGYLAISGLISFAIVYRYGPVTDERTLNLIQWFLQGVGLVIVYNSTQIREVSIALVLGLFVIYHFPTSFIWNQKSLNLWQRFFPPKIKLLTEDEYVRQGEVETMKELEKLRQYCQSPECKTWKVISKLKSPHRFAEFIMQGDWHISNEEMTTYSYYEKRECSDVDDADSELVFVLGSLSRTVRA